MNKFKVGNVVIHAGEQYRVMEAYDGCIQLHNMNPSYHHGVTIVRGEKHYKELKLYLPEILKKL